ncbi:hypothetical protein EJO69_07035 [Flaviflexus salsibiostraticola]|uniref:Uncharacterized protein n=1 Tax=Flaviflexus salsibiostraticola TaxID=1282737 RepID=A0A3Q8WTQ0_9ACTO|nr:hypothetical protein [Flaviflexus salsibiostraticola]AZN30089.1 hypothetical protein EJO69_07035 [Flaviflexus salsibiostraticola]
MTDEEFYVTDPRRAPKYGRFMLVGAILGALVGILLVQFGPNAGRYELSDVTFAVLLLTVPIGFALGALTALLLDRRSLKKTSE